LSSIGESSATQSGPVDTNTTELATDVYSSEDIHVAKWTARNNPETSPRLNSRRVRVRSSTRCRVMAIGASRRVAKVSRKAAMTREGAPSVCANRIKMDAVETARIAVRSAKGKMMRACGSGIQPF